MNMDSSKLKEILKQAQNGQTKNFNQFFVEVYAKCKPKLLQLTKSKFDTDDLFSEVMAKFWERFVIKQEPLPKENINGYVYRMCINAFHNLKRKQNSDKIDYKNKIPENHIEHEESEQDLWQELKKDEVKHTAFQNSLKKLCDKCKSLFDAILFEGKKLKDIWEPMGYKNYQLIVQAKYNCKKKLTRYFFIELENLKLNTDGK